MKTSGFRRLTYAEIIEKQTQARARKMARPKPAPVKKKEKTKLERVKTLKGKLWAIFSKVIRKRWADPITGMVLTCDGKMIYWNETHCGHLFNNSERNQSLGGNELWYDERNFAPQSSNGNFFNAEDSAKNYMLWAVRKYGLPAIEEMRRMKFTPRKFTEEELIAKVEYYQAEFEKLNG